MNKLGKIGVISRYIGECNSLNSATVKAVDALLLNMEDEKCLPNKDPAELTKEEIIKGLTEWYGEDFSGLAKVSKVCLDKLYNFFRTQ